MRTRYSIIIMACFLVFLWQVCVWGQGAKGNRNFAWQIQQTRQQLRRARGLVNSIPASGFNKGWLLQQLNRIESMLNNADYRDMQSKNRDLFSDYLFYGEPQCLKDGNLVSGHFDPNGMAARAERWADALKKRVNELEVAMKQKDEGNRKKDMAEAEKRLSNLSKLLEPYEKSKKNGGGPATDDVFPPWARNAFEDLRPPPNPHYNYPTITDLKKYDPNLPGQPVSPPPIPTSASSTRKISIIEKLKEKFKAAGVEVEVKKEGDSVDLVGTFKAVAKEVKTKSIDQLCGWMGIGGINEAYDRTQKADGLIKGYASLLLGKMKEGCEIAVRGYNSGDVTEYFRDLGQQGKKIGKSAAEAARGMVVGDDVENNVKKVFGQ